MPYFIYIITTQEESTSKSLRYLGEHDSFRDAKLEVKRLRAEASLPENQIYKIIFAADRSEAEQNLLERREQPIAREWEK